MSRQWQDCFSAKAVHQKSAYSCVMTTGILAIRPSTSRPWIGPRGMYDSLPQENLKSNAGTSGRGNGGTRRHAARIQSIGSSAMLLAMMRRL